MIQMAEFIIASRANKILRNARLGDVSYTNLGNAESGFYLEAVSKLEEMTPEMSTTLQRRLCDILYMIYPGTVCHRLLGIEDTQKARFHYPITVAEITIEDKKAYIPFYFGKSLLFAISTFRKEEDVDRLGDHFFRPICRISDINTKVLLAELDQYLYAPNEDGVSIVDKFKSIVDQLVQEGSHVCKAIENTFPNYKYGFESEIISCKDDSYRNWHIKMGLESGELLVDNVRGLILNPSDIINEMDFLPIVLHNFYRGDREEPTDQEDNGYNYAIMSVYKNTEDDTKATNRRICMRNNKGLRNEEDSYPVNELLALRDSGSLYPLFELGDEMYFYGEGRIAFFYEGRVFDTLDIDDIYETHKGYAEIHEHLAVTDDGVEYMAGTEGISDILSSFKVAGIRAGTGIYNTISSIAKLPGDVAKTLWNFVRRTLFMKQNTASKEMTDELREKALNDDLDELTGKMGKWLESGVLGLAAFFLTQSIIFGFVVWVIFHLMAKKNRARAMEPLEHQINTNIQVIDMKIRFAESEGDTTKIEELMRYRGHLLLMRHKTLRYKKELTGKEKLDYEGGKISEVERTGGGY